MSQPDLSLSERPPSLRLGRYALGREIGRGFSSIVYEATDTLRGRAVALKVLTLLQSQTPARRREMADRFEREARAISALSHPAIVAIYDVGRDGDGREFLAMERLEGETLRARMERGGPLLRAEALPLMVQIADALQYAHGRGIVHRDVKPDNIFLCHDGTARLMDFGVAHVFADEGLTQTGAVVGSPAYMSPEQINGEALDGRSDVFSLAVTLVEALTGRKPFEGPSIPAVMNRILNHPPQMAGVAPPALCRALERALAKEPGARTTSAGAFAEALRRALSSATLEADSATRVMTRVAQRQPRERALRLTRLALGLSLAALLLVSLITLALVTRRPSPAPRVSVQPSPPAAALAVPAPVTQPTPTARPAVAVGLPGDVRITEHTPARSAPAPDSDWSPAMAPAANADPLPDPVSDPDVPVRRVLVPSAQSAGTTYPMARTWFPAQPVRRPPKHSPPAVDPDAGAAPVPAEASPAPDTPPLLVDQTKPAVPAGVPPQSLPATVGLLLSVNESGDVFHAEVAQSSGDDRLDTAAVRGVLDWHYDPALRGARAVPAQVPAQVTFSR